jgi:hypothetical protein
VDLEQVVPAQVNDPDILIFGEVAQGKKKGRESWLYIALKQRTFAMPRL